MNLSKNLALSLGLALCGMLGAQASKADTLIPVQNSSFETSSGTTLSCGTGCSYNFGPIAGWTQVGGNSGSVQLAATNALFSTGAPDGSMIAYTNAGSLSQDLTGISLQANSTYTLSVFVGDRLDGETTDYSFSLLAGTTVLNTFASNNSLITPGTFQQEFLTFSTGSSVPTGDLSIVLSSATAQADWDDVALSVAPNSDPTNTPEPGTFMMLGAGILGLIGFAVPKSLKA